MTNTDHRPYIEVGLNMQGGTTHRGACFDCGWGTLWTADLESVRAEAEGHIRAEAGRLNRDEADNRARRAAVLGAAGFPDKAAVVATGGQGAVLTCPVHGFWVAWEAVDPKTVCGCPHERLEVR